MEAQATPRPDWAFPLALVLLGPFLFLSVILAVLAPITTLYLHQGNADRFAGRLWAWISVPLGALVCLLIKGPSAGIGYIVLAGLPGVFLSECLELRKKPEWAIATATLLSLALTVGLSLLFLWQRQGEILSILRGLTRTAILQLKGQIASNPNVAVTEAELAALIENPDLLLREFPGVFLAGLLVLHALPTLLLIRWNPKGVCRRLGIPRDFLRSYASPDWLVWPAIACLAGVIFEAPTITLIAKNLLKPLLVIYFFHGMSILAYFLDSFRLRGPLRYFLYGVGLMFLTPMVVSFGFFDLWFNFRSRFETTAKD